MAKESGYHCFHTLKISVFLQFSTTVGNVGTVVQSLPQNFTDPGVLALETILLVVAFVSGMVLLKYVPLFLSHKVKL
ncbi:hypothetical protein LLE49_24685 [Alicyclobacillus tolerans]|uniref:hypothetical protein n=1 Tax=Alicyclobacillus tolerans TaxID=90970 RepID=UPI001F16997B|nr:hypothetical protein [Alicyclobacillus tolerans]MCF8567924.1 hypothetical protein [Alicyclobacillus tolerans]